MMASPNHKNQFIAPTL